MNCKQGDLAIVVRCVSYPSAIGKIVRCVMFKPNKGRAAWIVDRPVAPERFKFQGKFMNGRWVLDSGLRPIRPNDGEDETLTWAGKPQKVTA